MIIGLALVAGCGFKLKGNFEVSSLLAEVSIKGDDRELLETLAGYLERSGSAIITTDQDDQFVTINITKSDYIKQTVSTDAVGVATGYDYNYNVEFEVIGKDGTTLLPSSVINQLRSLNYEAGNELEVEEEEAFLKEGMINEIALQMMRRLSRI